MGTIDYRTKTMFIETENPSVEGTWGMGIDIGYSGAKIFAPNSADVFPTFAVPMVGPILDSFKFNDPSLIYYREDKNSPVWCVGRKAQNIATVDSPEACSEAIYKRLRYNEPSFKIVARTAMAIATTKNGCGDCSGKELHVMSGLPNEYMDDAPSLKAVFAGKHSFDIKLGDNHWEHREINIADNVHIMPQPLGTLTSMTVDNRGKDTAELQELFTKISIVIDPGFITLDTFVLSGGVLKERYSFDNLGMHEVLLRTSKEIKLRYDVNIPVPLMQKALEEGFIEQFNTVTRETVNIPFDDILREKSKEVCEEAITRIRDRYNQLLGIDYVILTGGTGEAWYDSFFDDLKGIQRLNNHIFKGNRNTNGFYINSNSPYFTKGYIFSDILNGDKSKISISNNTKESALPFLFGNARGYYYFLNKMLRSKSSKVA